MLNKKVISALLCLSFVLMTASGFATSAKKAADKVEIEFWHTYSDTEVKIFNDEIIPAFEAKNPDIKVKATKMPYDGLKQQVVQAVSGDAAPDLMRMDIIWVPEFAKMGALQAVDSLDKFNDVKKNLFESPLSTNYYKGHYYGLPLNTNTKIAVYNNEQLKKAGIKKIPQTFDELIAAAKLSKKAGGSGIGVAGTGTWGMAPYFLSLGGKYTNDKYTKATGYLNSGESISALQKLVTYYDQKLIGPSVIGGQPSTWDGIKANKYLMIDDGPWFYSILGNDIKKITTPALLPGKGGKGISIVGGENLVMFKGAKHPKEAWKFMQYLLSEEPQKIMGKKAGLIPTNKVAANSKEIIQDPVIKFYVDQLKSTWARTPHPNYEKIQEKVDTAFEKVFRHKATAKQALDEAAKTIDKLLADM